MVISAFLDSLLNTTSLWTESDQLPAACYRQLPTNPGGAAAVACGPYPLEAAMADMAAARLAASAAPLPSAACWALVRVRPSEKPPYSAANTSSKFTGSYGFTSPFGGFWGQRW